MSCRDRGRRRSMALAALFGRRSGGGVFSPPSRLRSSAPLLQVPSASRRGGLKTLRGCGPSAVVCRGGGPSGEPGEGLSRPRLPQTPPSPGRGGVPLRAVGRWEPPGACGAVPPAHPLAGPWRLGEPRGETFPATTGFLSLSPRVAGRLGGRLSLPSPPLRLGVCVGGERGRCRARRGGRRDLPSKKKKYDS